MALILDMLQRKIGRLFQRLLKMFAIADDIVITGFDKMGRGHNATLDKVLRICR